MTIEGQVIDPIFLHVEKQAEVGLEAYDEGARLLREFFHSELQQFLVPDLMSDGRRIIEACLEWDKIERLAG